MKSKEKRRKLKTLIDLSQVFPGVWGHGRHLEMKLCYSTFIPSLVWDNRMGRGPPKIRKTNEKMPCGPSRCQGVRLAPLVSRKSCPIGRVLRTKEKCLRHHRSKFHVIPGTYMAAAVKAGVNGTVVVKRENKRLVAPSAEAPTAGK